ncbi:alpha/beta-hydrolase [Agrocybe pediades]|nr:alpha/beta-hydrolase [Agrocybe pediades]
MEKYSYKTIEYKKINESQPVLLDVIFPPLASTDQVVALPIVIHFHAGSLVVGNRQNLPTWLVDRVLASGHAFISADYRLLVPCTAHDTVEDLQDVFKFVTVTEFKGDDYTFRLDGDRIAVAGGSAGGLCTYLAAIHCNPKPKALISLYGSGGDFFTEHRLRAEQGDSSSVSDITFPYPHGPPAVETDVHVVLGSLLPSTDSRVTKRMALSNFLSQGGIYMDYYTGLHSPSISDALREVLKKGDATLEDFKQALPENTHKLFPLLCIDSQWPPAMILHGTADNLVHLESSHNIRDALKDSGVRVELIEIEGENHGFDIVPGAEEKHQVVFDRVKEFIRTYL